MKAACPSVSVITPSVGTEYLEDCIKGVRDQLYENVTHHIVVDGPNYLDGVTDCIRRCGAEVSVLTLNEATGKGGYYGHRIYAALPFLVNSDLVCFLDEDNWMDPHHIGSMVETLLTYDLDWVYSLRNIVNRSGTFICRDDCDSLGIWGTWYSEQNHVDTSCYLIKREIATTASNIWNRKGYDENVIDPDKALCRYLLAEYPRVYTTGKYSINYRIGSSSDTAAEQYFLQGNDVMSSKYRHFPWLTCRLDHIADGKGRRRILLKEEIESGELYEWGRGKRKSLATESHA